MIVEVLKSLSVLSQTLFQPDAILWTQLVQRLLEGDPIDLTHETKTTCVGPATAGDASAPMVVTQERRVEVMGLEPTTSTLRMASATGR
jgi:hypothetical protein